MASKVHSTSDIQAHLDRLDKAVKDINIAMVNRSWPYVEPAVDQLSALLEAIRKDIEAPAPVAPTPMKKETPDALKKGNEPKSRK